MHNSNPVRALLLAATWLIVFALPTPAQCLHWSKGFGLDSVDGSVHELFVHDDGTGPALFVGGEFSTAGDVLAAAIARWDGQTWSGLGSGLTGGAPTRVACMATFDDGLGGGPALYVGGDFTSAGGVPASGIARWDGVAWQAVGSGVPGSVEALCVHDDGSGPALYVGGSFASAGGVRASHIARWDGLSWSTLGGGADAEVRALAVLDEGTGPDLVAAGAFTSVDGVRAPNVARWDGSSWMAVGCGLSNSGPGAIVCSLAVYDEGAGPRLFAGALDSHDRSVARWDGRSWSQVGTGLWHIGGMTGPWPSVCDLVVHDDGSGAGPRLYAGGRFFCSWATGAPNVAAWDGVEWVALSQGIGGSYDRVDALAEYDDGAGSGPVLFAGGDFRPASGVPVWYLARWDGAEWSGCGFPTEGILGTVVSLAVYDAGSGSDLFAAGWFPAAGGVLHASIASWDGNAWHPLPGGGLGGTGPAHGSVAALEVFDPPGPARPVLVAAGTFQQIGGTALPGIGSWDGSAWSGLSTGLDHWVHDLTTADFGAGASLFACGYFGHAGNVKADHLARWDGSRWWGVGGGPGFVPLALLGCAESPDGGPALYVGGGYGPITSCIRRWDGTSWSPLGSGLDGPVLALAQYQGDVYAGGFFTHSGVQRVGHLARWDGSTWSDVSGGTDGDVAALGVWDDGSGSGPSLYVGGDFHHAGTLEAEGLARWDGSAWSSAGDVAPLQNGTYPSIMSFATHDDGNGPALFMGGAFRRVGDVPSSAIARLSNTCGVSPVAYCTAKVNSQGCTPAIGWSGTSSASDPTPFLVTATQVVSNKYGILFYGLTGAAAKPFQGGTLCVQGPIRRTGVQWSGGNPPPEDCSGSYAFDFNALIQSGVPVLVPGAEVRAQYWYRDPASPSATGLSDAIAFGIGP